MAAAIQPQRVVSISAKIRHNPEFGQLAKRVR